MWWEIFTFEIRYQLRRPLFYISSIVFFLIATALMASPAAGALYVLGGGVERNAPALIFVYTAVFSIIGLFVVTAFVSSTVLRDFEQGTFPFFFTRPVRKFDYLFGRFAGSMLVSAVLFLAVAAGMFAAQFVPGQDLAGIGAYRIWPYVASWIIIALPNLLVMGACLFAIAIWKRRAMWTYLFVVLYMLLQDVVESIAGRMNNTLLGSLLEPTGLGALSSTTRYWTNTEMNLLVPAFSGELLLNRIVWLAIAALIFAWGCWRFSYTDAASGAKLRPQKLKTDPTPASVITAEKIKPAKSAPKARQRFSLKSHFLQWFGQTRVELKSVVHGVPFIILLLLSVIFVFTFAWFIGQNRATPVWPLSYLMLRAIQMSMGTFLTVTLIFYAGELLWKERSLRFSDVYDALPVPNSVFLLSKLAALLTIAVIFIGSGIVSTLLLQLFRGYTNIEPLLYLTGFLALFWPFALLAVMTLFIQVLTGNKYLGFLLTILVVVYRKIAPSIGLEHDLLRYGAHPPLLYSDISGYGPYAEPYLWFNAYWSIVAILLLMAASILWVRGTAVSTRTRFGAAVTLWQGGIRRASLLTLVVLMACGSWIIYNTVVLNEFVSSKEYRQRAALYEQKYRDYKDAVLPRITAVSTEIDLYPESRQLLVKGRYKLINETDTAIHLLPVTTKPRVFRGDILPFGGTVNIKRIGLPNNKLKISDDQLGFQVYELEQALEPGERIEMTFELSVESSGFKESGIDQRILNNGTFFANKNIFPALGYLPGRELQSPRLRRKHGLTGLSRTNPIDDLQAQQDNYLLADWVQYETTISTSARQTAIAPGRLVREWQEGDRRYFHYKTDTPIVNLTTFMSAEFEVIRDKHGDVELEIYYHPGHDWNLERMMRATSNTLDYAEREFSPYPHKQLRIVEVPNYIGLTAMSLGGTIPFSESWGFTSRISGDALDSVTKVIAHEVAHQWWNHQVVPANVQGASFISETLSEYTSLMVMEKETSDRDMQRHLRFELDRYFKGRNREQIGEMPLNLVEEQPYVYYSKGSLAIYGIKDMLGEQALNQALRQFLQANAFSGPPYPTSRELIDAIRSYVPEELETRLSDVLETITLFDIRLTNATSRKTEDGDYALEIQVDTRKMRADKKGVETDIPIDDPVDIVVYGEDDNGTETVLYKRSLHANSATRNLEIKLKARPVRVLIDPYFKLIDRIPDDNSRDVDETTDPA